MDQLDRTFVNLGPMVVYKVVVAFIYLWFQQKETRWM